MFCELVECVYEAHEYASARTAHLRKHDAVVVLQVAELTAKGVILTLLHIVELATGLVQVHDDILNVFKWNFTLAHQSEDVFP